MNRYKFIDEEGEHLHTLDGKPLIGTSTALKVLSKPLTWWAAGKAVEKLGWTNSKIKVNGKYQAVPFEKRAPIAEIVLAKLQGMEIEEYLKLLDEAYCAHSETKKEAAEKGTDRHEVLETYVKECIRRGEVFAGTSSDPTVQSFIDWAQKNVKRFLWSELHGYHEGLWTGGIADVGWEDMEGRVVAGDFKSSREAYIDQFFQIAGYDLMITENGGFSKDGDKIFTLESPIVAYCVIPFGMEALEPQFEYDVESAKEGFRAAVALHKIINK